MTEAASGSARGPESGRRRVIIEGVEPQVDCGRFPAKRCVGDAVVVEADVFTDGHDSVCAQLLYRPRGEERWRGASMEPIGNDRWRAAFTAETLGRWEFTIVGWVDHWGTWRADMRKRVDAGVDVPVNLRVGAALIEAAAGRADAEHAERLGAVADTLRDEDAPLDHRVRRALAPETDALMRRYPDRTHAVTHRRVLEVRVDPRRARFSAWYELFPRSAGPADRHGTFRDVEALLPYIAELGFDVLYLPPIHPIGRTNRKGKNNARRALEGDVGSPWAIGAEEGGHKAIHPELGTPEDFRRLVRRAREDHGIEVALDIAFQAAPDHPYTEAHPEWFRQRPDGSIQYAENPPKKYEDIYPFDFETEAWQALWHELRSVFEHWIEQGVRIFRVDNPHTKAFPFWEWCIGALKAEHPETIFLSEAFTRPKVMYRLAKLGFDQSYTYFAWRQRKPELQDYFTELTGTKVREFFRPNLWPNTPDILTEELQTGERPVFIARLVLAATLGASYGIYGPAFELMESRPRERGSEEYLDSEKYQLRSWELEREDSLKAVIGRVNRIRRHCPALQQDRTLRFVDVDNEHLIAYAKTAADGTGIVLVVVNLDPYHTHAGTVDVPIHDWGIDPDEPYTVRDMLSEARYQWQGWRNYVELNPFVMPAHIFRIHRDGRSEEDFEYF